MHKLFIWQPCKSAVLHLCFGSFSINYRKVSFIVQTGCHCCSVAARWVEFIDQTCLSKIIKLSLSSWVLLVSKSAFFTLQEINQHIMNVIGTEPGVYCFYYVMVIPYSVTSFAVTYVVHSNKLSLDYWYKHLIKCNQLQEILMGHDMFIL